VEALALPDDDRTPVEVRGVGRVLVRDPLSPVVARALLVDHNSDLDDIQFRDRWLAAATDFDQDALSGLSDAARHRLAVAILRVRGLGHQWRRLYGSPHPPARRLRIVVGDDLGRQAGTGRAPAGGAVIDLAQFRRSTQALTRSVRPALERLTEVVVAPFRAILERIMEALRPALETFRRKTDQLVRAPAFKQSLRLVDTYQRRISEAIRPMEALFRSRDEIVRHFGNGATAAPQRPEEVLELPDATTLAVFYGQERADPEWRVSEVGWLLAAVPLSIGAVIHERFGVSPIAGLAWMAERFARREMRCRILGAFDSLQCSDSLHQRLHDGADHFFDEHYHSADSLLTVGLDGLLFELGEQRGVLSTGHKLITGGKARGARITSGSNGRLLHALGFNPSQKDYLAHLSLGRAGNPPRHGHDAEFGSREHAAAALLGILMVLAHVERDQRRIVGLLR
jgi:hypothetical protein